MTNICLKKREETDEACFNAIMDCDLKKKNHKSWSDEDEYEEENNHERMENQCFMAMEEINKKNLNEYNKFSKEKKNWEIQLDQYKKLMHEKKDWEIQLEEYNKLRNEKNEWDTQLKEYLVENNLLQEENFELRKQIRSLHKSPIHYFDRSKSSPWLNSYKSTEKGSTSKRPTLNKLIEESSKSTNKAAAGARSSTNAPKGGSDVAENIKKALALLDLSEYKHSTVKQDDDASSDGSSPLTPHSVSQSRINLCENPCYSPSSTTII
ncbi:uncharacterized protein [Nicotiana sylvestris]|uniref:uncharacterized protein n=1 Tax=Nicotiana sylvestris TaxID=4096 RepID=UPI00388CE4E5